MEKLNRIKGALADAGKTNIWLATQIGRDPVTVSKWCTNTSQPDLHVDTHKKFPHIVIKKGTTFSSVQK